ncbi:reverse transcriptase domain-containing protein [Tanacetum coccineum]|uniref:Reverse transcriptase domain-containing protein n=1 Tax=Tanacetum coccineum TaxID=301880 RepID=A0ABQ5CE32_9ASTR
MLQICHGHGLPKELLSTRVIYHGLDEPIQGILDITARGIFLYKSPNQAFQFLEDKVLFKLDWSIKSKNEHHQKSVSFADGSDSNTDNSRLMEKLEALTIKMNSQIISLNEELQDMREKYNELRNGNASKNNNETMTLSDCVNMSGSQFHPTGGAHAATETIVPVRNVQSSNQRQRNSLLQQNNGKNNERYGVNHRFSTSYHPQTSGQVENTNRAFKRILKKTVKDNPTIWSRKLDDALWAFRNAYKTPTGTTPYKLIYGNNCHLPFEIEHRAYWALKNCNPDLIATGEKRMFQLHELDKLRHQAYENSRLYKARTKVWHDKKFKMRKEFKQGNKVLLFHSKYRFKQPKLRSRWFGPYVVKHQYPSGYVELYGKDGKMFIVNGHRLKLYHEEDNDPREAVTPFFPKELLPKYESS